MKMTALMIATSGAAGSRRGPTSHFREQARLLGLTEPLAHGALEIQLQRHQESKCGIFKP